MPQVERYTGIIRGGTIFTGNTLGFSDLTRIDIGAFLSTDTTTVATGYPSPSSFNWTSNGSTAQLNIPIGAKIEYAELVWSGTEVGTITPALDTNTTITFKTPLTVTPLTFDPLTSQSSTGGSQVFYTRSQNVTSLVEQAGSGTYEVLGVSSSREPNSPQETSATGWTLCVIVSRQDLPYQSITYYVSSFTSSGGDVDTTFTGFLTPFKGSFRSRVLISALEGNTNIANDFVALGATTATLNRLSGPNNNMNAFFSSQINNANSFSPNVGLLDTSGSFGTLNQTPGTFTSGVRSGLDITNVAGTTLPNGQTSAILRFGTTGDTYEVFTFAFQVDINQATLTTIKSVDKELAEPGDTLTYTVAINNSGNDTALNILFIDTIPNDTTFIEDSFTVNGVPITGASPQPPGVTLPNIGDGTTQTITFKVIVNTIPSPNPIPNSSFLNYSFLGTTTITDSVVSNTVNTEVRIINRANLSGINKLVDKRFATCSEVITYTIILPNTGTTTAINVVVRDTIPNGTVLVPNSVTVNGVTQSGANPITGVTIPNIAAGATATLTFSVQVQC